MNSAGFCLCIHQRLTRNPPMASTRMTPATIATVSSGNSGAGSPVGAAVVCVAVVCAVSSPGRRGAAPDLVRRARPKNEV